MTNEKMNFADLKLLERGLHRELTDDEAMLGYTKGVKALLEYIGMNEEKYAVYNQLLELLITYCTGNKIEFAKLRQSNDYTDAFALLSDFIIDCRVEDVPEKKGFDMCDQECAMSHEYVEDKDEECISIDEVIEYFANNFTSKSSDNLYGYNPFWYVEYCKCDPNLSDLKNYVQTLFDDDEEHVVEDEFDNMFNIVKQSTIEMTANRLAQEGKPEKLSKELIQEVCKYIENNWTNYMLQVIDDNIKIKKY